MTFRRLVELAMPRRIRLGAVAGAFAAASSVSAQTTIVSVNGVAYDSLRGVPLGYAQIAVVGAAKHTTADARGRFHFDSLALGTYTFVAQHEALDSVGFSGISARATLGTNETNVTIALPSFATLWRAACGGTPPSPKDSGFVFGTIRDAVSRTTVAGATVELTWTELLADSTKSIFQRRYRARARSDATGSYAICGVPAGDASRIQAATDSLASGLIDLPETALGVQRRDLLVLRAGNAYASARGTIIGMLSKDTGGPFADARVVMDEVPEVRSGADGRFIIRNVPAGTRQIEILSIGMRPAVTAVDVVAHDTVSLALTLRKITTLEAMRVTASSRQMSVVRDIESRRKAGLGYMKDSTALWGTISSAVEGFPGVTVMRGFGSQFSVALRNMRGGYCLATLYIDGHREYDQEQLSWLRTDDIATMEIYPRVSSTPAEFLPPAREPCGAIVVWTKLLFR